MAQPITLVGQYCMDSYFQNFKADSDFFSLEDFVYHAGSAVADYYRQEYQQKYAENKLEKKDEVISFSADILIPQILKVEKKIAPLSQPVMSFAYDQQNIGVQEVFVTSPSDCVELERGSLTQLWWYKLLPPTNRIFWWVQDKSIRFFNKGEFNVQEVQVLYVPAISNSMLVPDSIVDFVITNTVAKMKEMKNGTIIKKGVDGNQNQLIQTEIDKRQLQ